MTEMHQIEQLFRAKNLWQKRGGTQSLLTSLAHCSRQSKTGSRRLFYIACKYLHVKICIERNNEIN